jgi:site-specific recombinase XerD
MMTAMGFPVPVRAIDDGERAARLAAAFVASRKSENTKAAYGTDLGLWLGWCRARDVDPLDARHAHTLLWLAERRTAGDGEATLARRLSAVGSFYRWLLREGQAARNPTDLDPAERPHASREHLGSIALSDAQVDALLAAADTDSPRTAAVIALLAYCGIRVGELTAANVEDITYHQGQPILVVTGKGKRHRDVPLPAGVYARLDAYLRSRSTGGQLPAPRGEPGRTPLITTSTGRRLDRLQVRRDVKRAARRAGLGDVADLISPHATRHSYATALIRDGVPVRDVQRALGHASPVTTERYDHGSLALDRHPTYRRATQLTGHQP